MIDVGGGDSRLVDRFVGRGFRCVSVLDISGTALRRAQQRLPNAGVTWIEADVTGDWRTTPARIWHDRAVFHFLTAAADRAAYVRRLHETLERAGHAIIGAFGIEGPPRCSGLPVIRYTPAALAGELGPEFDLIECVYEDHHTPTGVVQPFCFCRFLRK